MTTVLTNATLVLPHLLLRGSLQIDGARIGDIQPGAARGTDLDGDFLIPGAIDLHTDNLERQVEPRQNARWPSRAALLAHDAQCAAAGITTVLNALCAGQAGLADDRPRTCRDGVADLDALLPTGLLKADHYLHLRCELPAADMLAQAAATLDHARLLMVSLMDHTPGCGQFNDLPRYRAMLLRDGLDAAGAERRIVTLLDEQVRWASPNRQTLLAALRTRAAIVASHDDATEADIEAHLADGIRISEFPVSLRAATAAKARFMRVIAGAPNLVRGGSHAGNIAVADLLDAGLVDALASDYVPASLVHAAFLAAHRTGLDLPLAIALVTSAPAAMVGLTDRGALATGLRADLVRVRLQDGIPVIRQVWRAGERVI